MCKTKEALTEGWFWAWPNSKRHYFRNGKSLCGNATIVGGIFREDVAKDHTCSECFFMRKEEKE